jgi:hypothetical protein
MARHLIVSGAFGDFRRGDRITDPELVAEALEKHPSHVIPIAVADEPEAEADEA